MSHTFTAQAQFWGKKTAMFTKHKKENFQHVSGIEKHETWGVAIFHKSVILEHPSRIATK